MLITGGLGAERRAEIYHPDRDSACELPDLPDQRAAHTQDGSLLCGGLYNFRSCRRWNTATGAWDLVTESLTGERAGHTSWTPADGSVTYLMGGYTPETYDVIDQENGVITSHPLQHSTV